MEIKYWAGTDVGRKRAGNEDNFLIDKQLKLFVVADGMGGHASGDIASAMAVHSVRDVVYEERDIFDTYDDTDPRSHVEVCTLLEYAVHRTCATIHNKARLEPEKRGMGTTLVVLLIIGTRGFIAYVGDSRIYLLRGGIVYQLTEDHSLKNELIRMGKITADEFADSPYASLKNAMTRAVGVYESVEVDTLDFDIIPGDTFMLCSDGLYEYLHDDDIANTLALPDVKAIPGALIDLANKRGGKDNITGVVIQVAGDGTGDRAAEINFTLDTLKGVPIFAELSYQQLVRILNLADQRAVLSGQTIFCEGDDGDDLIVILRGEVELTRDGVAVATLNAGAHLGEMSLIDTNLRSATATVMESGKVLSISRKAFYEILRREPRLAVKLLWSFLQILSGRLRKTTSDLADAKTATALVPDFTGELLVDEEASDGVTAKRRATSASAIADTDLAEIARLADLAEPTPAQADAAAQDAEAAVQAETATPTEAAGAATASGDAATANKTMQAADPAAASALPLGIPRSDTGPKKVTTGPAALPPPAASVAAKADSATASQPVVGTHADDSQAEPEPPPPPASKPVRSRAKTELPLPKPRPPVPAAAKPKPTPRVVAAPGGTVIAPAPTGPPKPERGVTMKVAAVPPEEPTDPETS